MSEGSLQETAEMGSITTEAPRARWRLWPLFVGLAVVVLAIPVGLALAYVLLIDGQTKAQAQMAQTFMRDLQTGKTDAAYSLTTKTFQAATDPVDFQNTAAMVASTVGGATPTVVVRRLQTNFGISTTYVSLNLDGSEAHHALVLFRKDAGKWKVNGFQVKAGLVDKDSANNEITDYAGNLTQ